MITPENRNSSSVSLGLFLTALIIISFFIINYVFLDFKFNLYEFTMFVLVSFFSIQIYSLEKNYLNPVVYFPILYFFLYWVGNFDFGLGYLSVPANLWKLFLLGLVGFYIGSLSLNFCKFNGKIKAKKIRYMSKSAGTLLFILFILSIACKLIIFKQSGIPILSGNVDLIRENAAENFGALKVFASAYTILTVYFICDCLERLRYKRLPSPIFYIVIVVALVISILDGSRLLIIQIIIPALIYYIVKIRKIKLKTIIAAGLMIILFISINKFIRNILENPNYLVAISSSRGNSLFENIFLSGFSSFRVAIDCLRQLVDVVPHYSPYTHGQMFLNSILTILPGKQIIIGYYVATLLQLNFNGIGAATTILGLFYLDGGYILVFIGMLIFGAFIEFNYKKYLSIANFSNMNLVPVYLAYYSIYCLRTNVMPNIEPVLNLLYYAVFFLIISAFNNNSFEEK